ncbi:MAG: TonB-dependent receptor [Pseudomonadota bacterium]|nr:TonB-dependent receptor [Pseudomonadota bacterium]
MSKRIFKDTLLASTVIAGMTVFSTPAFAQQSAAQPVEAQPDLAEEAPGADAGDIVVTGSRISRPNLEQSSPVSVIDAQEISLTQPTSAEEFLRDLPGSVPGTNPTVNNGANGSATLNLRGLGTNRNLILLNERRIVPATLGGVVDLNIIPVALLERTDVFTGGASSAYGADAVAGVVNFITRRNFAGFDINANYGITERGDGANRRLDLTTGANFDDGRGNAVFSVSYTKTDPVLQGNRAIGTVSRASTCTTAQVRAGQCDTLQVGVEQGSSAAAPASIFFPFVGRINESGTAFERGVLNNFNFNPLNVFQTPLDRYSIFGQARYEVSEAIEVYTEGFFTRSQVLQQIAPGSNFFSSFRLPLNNQFLTPTMRQQLCEGAIAARNLPAGTNCAAAIAAGTEITALIPRRFVEAGPRLTQFNTNTFQVVAGLRGALTEALNWNISAQYGESQRINQSQNQGLASRFQQSIRNCPAGSDPGCVPINIFGPQGSLQREAFDFINVTTNTFQNTELGAAQAVIEGDLGIVSPLANEGIGIAVGAEYRRVAGSQRGDLPSSTPGAVLGAGGAFTAVEGEFDVKEAFAEVVIPLIEDRPFFHNLTVEAGARYSDYSTSGGSTTYKVGGSYSPIRDIKFRGVYSRAVRAPNLTELFSPQNTVLNNLAVDPCQGSLDAVRARGPNNEALCRAQLAAVGLPATQLGNVPAPIAGQINVTVGGNPNLDPEVATTLTAGVVFQPQSIVPGLAVTFDWYRIKVRDAISSPTVSDILNGCFGQSNPQDPRCQSIRRSPLTGGLSGGADQVQGVLLASSNLGRLHAEGFDATLGYTRDLGFARLRLSANGNHTTKSRFQATPSSFNRECVGFYSVSCDPPLPRYSANVRTTLGIGESDISLSWRYISSTRYEPRTGPNATTPPAPGTVGSFGSVDPATVVGAYRSISDYNFFDLAFQHEVSENMRMTIVVQNLFDKDPPDVGNTIGTTAFNSGNTYPSVYDPLGRRYTVAVNLRF